MSVYGGLTFVRSTMRNRGVKKAPFVVLIGANMPSILAEISFVSNPDRRGEAGQTPEYRQKIAESIYKGICQVRQRTQRHQAGESLRQRRRPVAAGYNGA